MNGGSKPPAANPFAEPAASTPDPGLQLLLDGAKNGASADLTVQVAKPRAPEPTPASSGSTRAALIVGDLLLLSLAALLVFGHGGSVGWMELTVAVTAVAVGGWLGCLALWKH